jgi:hypothetical protein
MSSSYSDDRRSEDATIRFINKLLERGDELLRKFNELKDSPDKTEDAYKILKERHDLFVSAEKDVSFIHPYYKFFIMAMRDNAFYHTSIVWTKNQFEEQVSQIVSRLDDLENEVKRLKEKLNLTT